MQVPYQDTVWMYEIDPGRMGRSRAGDRHEPARQRTILLLGHERHGIPDEVLATADVCVEIPMRGVGHSLDVAVAGSLVAYRLAGLA